jgi:hypothetical protein
VFDTVTTIAVTGENELEELSKFKENFFRRAIVLRTLSGDEDEASNNGEEKETPAGDIELKNYEDGDEAADIGAD